MDPPFRHVELPHQLHVYLWHACAPQGSATVLWSTSIVWVFASDQTCNSQSLEKAREVPAQKSTAGDLWKQDSLSYVGTLNKVVSQLVLNPNRPADLLIPKKRSKPAPGMKHLNRASTELSARVFLWIFDLVRILRRLR